MEIIPASNSKKFDAKSSKYGNAASSSRRNDDQYDNDSNVRVPDGRRLKQSKSLTSAPEF